MLLMGTGDSFCPRWWYSQPLMVMLSFCQVTAGSEPWVVVGDGTVHHPGSIRKKAPLVIKESPSRLQGWGSGEWQTSQEE